MSSRPPHTCLQPCDVRGRMGPLALLPGLSPCTTPTPTHNLRRACSHACTTPVLTRPTPCPCRQGRATTLVLSHGYGAGLALYFGLFDRLLDAGKYDRVIAFDWNGFGVRRHVGSLPWCAVRGASCPVVLRGAARGLVARQRVVQGAWLPVPLAVVLSSPFCPAVCRAASRAPPTSMAWATVLYYTLG